MPGGIRLDGGMCSAVLREGQELLCWTDEYGKQSSLLSPVL